MAGKAKTNFRAVAGQSMLQALEPPHRAVAGKAKTNLRAVAVESTLHALEPAPRAVAGNRA